MKILHLPPILSGYLCCQKTSKNSLFSARFLLFDSPSGVVFLSSKHLNSQKIKKVRFCTYIRIFSCAAGQRCYFLKIHHTISRSARTDQDKRRNQNEMIGEIGNV